jgi:3-oxoacyl-[acyl-carrier-protein] synthase II
MTTSAATREVVITGLAAITPLGDSVPATLDALLEGACAEFEPSGHGPAPSFEGLPIRRREAKRLTRADSLAVVAAGRAAVQAGLADDPAGVEAAALYLGTSKDLGSYEEFLELLPAIDAGAPESVSLAAIVEQANGLMSPFFLLDCMPNLAMHYVATMFGIRGDNCCFTGLGCAGAEAVERVARAIAGGTAELGLAGGFDRLSDPFNRSRLLAQWFLADDPAPLGEGYRPFHQAPGCPVFVDGAGALVLEEGEHARRRGAEIHGRLLAVASACVPGPPYGVTAGGAIRSAVAAALSDAGLAADELAFVVASGQGERRVDAAEAQALRGALGGAPVPITAWKGGTGHLMSAAAPVELGVALACLQRGVLAPLAGATARTCEHGAPVACEHGSLRFALTPIAVDGAAAMVISLGVRGQAHAFILGRKDS